MRISAYQTAAIAGSTLMMISGLLRYFHTGSPKELAIGMLYFLANLVIFCI